MEVTLATDAAQLAAKPKLLPLPDVGDIIFILLMQIPLVARPNFLFGDGSTGWHLVTGNFILDTHTIPHKDLMSYTMAGKDWVAYEWLSDMLMAMVVRAGGLNLLAVLVSTAICWLFILLYDRCRKEGLNFLGSVGLILPAIMISAMHWLVRPHIFTFYGIYIFATRLEDYYRGTISSAGLLLPLSLYMLLWVNTHPAFLLGYVLIIIYLFSAIVSAIYCGMKEYGSRVRTIALALACTVLASFANPYGPRLYEYIVEYLKGSRVLAATDEFASPIFHGGFQPMCLELLFALLLISLTVSRNRLTMPRLLACMVFSHLTLSAVRNMPLFAIVVTPAIAYLFSSVRQIGKGVPEQAAPSSEIPSPGVDTEQAPAKDAAKADLSLAVLSARWKRMSTDFDKQEAQCKMHLLPIVYVVFLVIASLNGGHLMGNEIVNSGWDPKDKPTATLEYLKKHEQSHELDPTRGFNFDNWGGYLRYKLDTPVYMDDRADFYGEKFYMDYGTVSLTMPGWQGILDKQNIQWIIFPRNSRLAFTLKSEPGWKLVAEDEAASVFVRDAQHK